MMANFILKTLFIYSTVFASNIDEEDQIFTYFIKAFDDENNIQNWVKARNKGNLHALNLFKKIISKVRDVLLLIYIDERDDIKTLIFETNMDIKKIGDQYFEAINIISSLKRIIIINDEYSGSNFQSHNVSNFFLNVLYNEYENIYYDIKWMLMIVGVRYNTMETLCLNPRWLSSNEFQSFESEIINRNILITENIFNLSNEMIDSIIPTIDSKATYVEANFFGFINSKKCCGDGMNSFTLEKSTKIYTEKMLQFTLKCSTEQCIYNKIDMKKYMDIGFICNRTTAKLLITLFHFYSEIREYNTTYEIFLQENGDYLIYWSLSDTQPKEEIKTYWQQKEIIEFIDTKIIHKFGLIIDYDTEYSTKKSDETENEPISTKLILMSCGHQLGFELIDEFLEYFHTGTTSSKCHICRIPIWIVGSYDTVVYKCK